MRLAALALAVSLTAAATASAQMAASTPAPADKKGGPAVTRISYWTTKPGKGAEAHAFWKPFAAIFEEMKKKGILIEYQFLAPAIHTGQDWDLAYIWVCRDMAAYGQADQYFNDAIAKMDGKQISTDFDAAFDGSKHRDEIWRAVEIK